MILPLADGILVNETDSTTSGCTVTRMAMVSATKNLCGTQAGRAEGISNINPAV